MSISHVHVKLSLSIILVFLSYDCMFTMYDFVYVKVIISIVNDKWTKVAILNFVYMQWNLSNPFP